MKRKMMIDGRLDVGVRVCCRVPFDLAQGLLPVGLEAVRRGDFAFVEVAAGRVGHLRLAGLPEVLGAVGVGFNQVAYRVHVQAMTDQAEVVRGLYTLRTECDAALLGRLARRVTGLDYEHAIIEVTDDDCHVQVQTTPRPHGQRGGVVGLDLAVTHLPAALMPGSCFPTIEDARTFCGFQPALLGIEEAGAERYLTRIDAERVGGPGCETPVGILRSRWGFFEEIGIAEHLALEWAVRVSPVAMRWRVGERAMLLGTRRGGASAASAREADDAGVAASGVLIAK